MLPNTKSKFVNVPSRPGSRGSVILPEILLPRYSIQRQMEKNNNSQLLRQNDISNNQRWSVLDQQALKESSTSRYNDQSRKELIRDIFESQTQRRPMKKEASVRFETEQPMPKSIMKNESILKRKSSNSREHTDIEQFFEIQDKKQNLKKISLEPIVSEASLSPKKIVSFNKLIQIKVIGEEEEQPQQPQQHNNHRIIKPLRTSKKHFTLNDLQD